MEEATTEGTMDMDRMDNNKNEDQQRCTNDTSTWRPEIGMDFTSVDEAWKFWLLYGGEAGFHVRKKYENKSPVDKVITSVRYVCSNQGVRREDERDHLTKHPRDETRTGLMNIKQLPDNYILKRWTRGVRSGIVQDVNGRNVLEDPKLEVSRRHRFLSYKFNALVSQASDYEECFRILDNALDNASREMDDVIKESTVGDANKDEDQVISQASHASPQIVGLKKRDVKKGGSKRKKDWVQKMQSGSRRKKPLVQKTSNKQPTTEGEGNKENTQPQPQPVQASSNWFEKNEFAGSYMNLLLGESNDDDHL